MKRIAMTVAGLVLAGCVQMTPIADAKPVQASPALIADIQSAVTRDFYDPGSAQFRSIRVVDVTLKDGTRERRVCGEVNGKNLMGAYVGFRMFGGTVQNGRFVRQDFFSACEAW